MAYIDKLRPAVARFLNEGEAIDAAARGVARGMTKFAVLGALAGFIPTFVLVQSSEPSLASPLITGLGVGVGVGLGYLVGALILSKRGFPAIFTLATTGSRLLVFERDFWGRIVGVALSPPLSQVTVEVGKGGFLAANPGTVNIKGTEHKVQFPKVENLEPFVDVLGR
ncbi:MAG: hypothetical protein HKN93_03995 [Acidimicrobiia bacterium]|nr:hypothetical protein [Acidimicrobiia bacterium]